MQITAYKICMYIARKKPAFCVYLIVNVNLHIHSTMKFVYISFFYFKIELSLEKKCYAKNFILSYIQKKFTRRIKYCIYYKKNNVFIIKKKYKCLNQNCFKMLK